MIRRGLFVLIGVVFGLLTLLGLLVDLCKIVVFVFLFPVDVVWSAVTPDKLPADIWAIVKTILRNRAVQIVGHKIYQISNDADESNESEKRPRTSGVTVEALATFEDWKWIVAESNRQGVWLANVSWLPLGTTRKFVYSFYAVTLKLELLPSHLRNKFGVDRKDNS